MMSTKSVRTVLGLLVAVSVMAGLTARPTVFAAPPVQGDESVTLRIWDQFTDEGLNAAAEVIYAAFEAANPNIQIEREVATREQMIATANTALASGTGPDLIYFDTGPGNAGLLAESGLLMPLDDYAAKHGWDERIFQWARDRATFDGQLYGLGGEIEFIGMYVNQTLLDETGLAFPENAEDLPEFCAQAQEQGLIPIAFGDAPGWQSFHQFGMVANNALGIDEMERLLFGGEADWTRPELVAAVTLFFETMLDAGCFIPDVNAVNYDDANALFFSGQALAHSTGTWLIGDIERGAPDYEITMRPFPAVAGNTPVLPAGLGSAWFMSASTAHPDEAALFLDHLFSDESVKTWLTAGRIIPPVVFDPATAELSPLQSFAVETLQGVEQGETDLGFYIDTAAPEAFNALMQDGFQAVLAKTKTPEQQLADLQQAWDEGQS
ncbi:MAG: ABC transporter substrate-binding protein [Thermomicrobiales bacterium]